MSSVFNGLDVFIALLNTFVRLMPLGMYFFAYFSLTIYKDYKVGILLLGLIFNEFVGYSFKKYSGKVFNDACAIFGSPETRGNLAFLNNSHIEIITFVASFFFMDMFSKGTMDWFRFNFLVFLMIITIWSRMSVGCINSIEDVIFNVLFGLVLGGLFYYFFSDSYVKYEEGIFKKEKCDMGYQNYKCETIKDGKLIVNHDYDIPSGDNETSNDNEEL